MYAAKLINPSNSTSSNAFFIFVKSFITHFMKGCKHTFSIQRNCSLPCNTNQVYSFTNDVSITSRFLQIQTMCYSEDQAIVVAAVQILLVILFYHLICYCRIGGLLSLCFLYNNRTRVASKYLLHPSLSLYRKCYIQDHAQVIVFIKS